MNVKARLYDFQLCFYRPSSGQGPVESLIGIGEDLTTSPSHTTGHTGHVSGGSLNDGGSHDVLADANSGSPI